MDVIGKMDQRVTLRLRGAHTRDAAGDVIRQYVEVSTWAGVNMKPTGSDERLVNRQLTAQAAVDFKIRNTTSRTVTTNDFVRYRGKDYAIRSVLEIDSRAYLLLETEFVDLPVAP